ncbi:MAG: MgtC/SapB family protein [Saprospiraceae bacterium]|nr:MgtC/SapB family protein [Saprospiraceae bacterium]
MAITLGTGLLIGWNGIQPPQDSDHHAAFAGIRTFMLVTLTGYLSMVMGELVHPAFIPVMAGGILLLQDWPIGFLPGPVTMGVPARWPWSWPS